MLKLAGSLFDAHVLMENIELDYTSSMERVGCTNLFPLQNNRFGIFYKINVIFSAQAY